MKARKNLKNLISFVLILVICLFQKALCFADVEPQILKVGYTEIEGFIEKDNNGDFFGYAVDYLNEISKCTDLKFEFVEIDWNEALSSLGKSEIDLVCNAKYSKERAKKFDFSSQRLGIVNGVLYSKENSDIYLDDYNSLDGKTIGFIKGSLLFNDFKNFAEKNNFTFESKFYNNATDLSNSLKMGETRLIVSHSMIKPHNLILVGDFCSYPFYIMCTKDKDFIDEINWGISCINAKNKDFEYELVHKYYGVNARAYNIGFTRDEKNFIDNCPVIRVAVLDETKPMVYRRKDGRFTGITIDILDEISKKSGLKFEYVGISPRNYERGQDFFTSKYIDLISCIDGTSLKWNEDRKIVTEPYFTYNKFIVSRNGELVTTEGNQRIAIADGSKGYKYLVKRHLPNLEILCYTSATKCLNAVAKYQADFFLYNEYLLKEQLSRPQYSNLSIVPGINIKENAVISPVVYKEIYKDKQFLKDEKLVSVINKSIKLVNPTTIQNIVEKHTNLNDIKLCFADVIYKYRACLMSILGIILILIAFFIHIILKKLKQCKKLNKTVNKFECELEKLKETRNLKTNFISNISQEIKIILNNIVGVTSVAKQYTNNSEKSLEYLGKINSLTDILVNINNDIIDMTALEIKKFKIKQVPFDIKDVLTSVSNIYYYKCKSKGIDFSLTTSNLLNEEFCGDELRINQILFNLISNSLKFTKKGGNISVSVSQKKVDGTKAIVKFVVSDTGIGISDEIKEIIFKPYQKGENETENKGSGLGLSITKNIVDLMGGKIYFESEKGKGSKFIVELPLDIVYDCVQINNFMFKDIKALVIDEYEKDKGFIAPILKTMGIEISQVGTIEQGVQHLIEHSKANSNIICFVDWDIKSYNPKAVIKKIRHIYGKDIKIITYSYDLLEAEEQSKRAGADIFMKKPIFMSTIYKNLLFIVDKYKVADTGLHQNLRGKRILLGEDNKKDSEIIIQILNMFGAEVDYAPDGKVALNKFKYSPDGTYDIVLLSLKLPILDGYSVTREIRTSFHPQAKMIPIYAMVNGAVCEETCTAVLNGLNGYVSKPIETNNLYLTLSSVNKNKASNKTHKLT